MWRQRYHFAVFFAVMVILFYITYPNWLQKLRESLSAMEVLCTNNTSIDFNVHHCITGDVIGTRPSVLLVPYSQRTYHKEPENKTAMRAAFQYIFDNRIWGGNKRKPRTAVTLRASGTGSFLLLARLMGQYCFA